MGESHYACHVYTSPENIKCVRSSVRNVEAAHTWVRLTGVVLFTILPHLATKLPQLADAKPLHHLYLHGITDSSVGGSSLWSWPYSPLASVYLVSKNATAKGDKKINSRVNVYMQISNLLRNLTIIFKDERRTVKPSAYLPFMLSW